MCSPEQAPWLTEDEREWVTARLRVDQGHSAAERKVTLRDAWAVLRDYRVILGGLMYFGLVVSVRWAFHSLKRAPSHRWGLTLDPGVWLRILRTDHSANVSNSWPPPFDLWQSTRRMLTWTSYKFDPITTQLRSVPPWAASFVYSLLIAVFSDMFRHRYLFTLLSMLISFAGYGILINVHNNLDLQYAALFLVCMGTYGAMPILVCWFNMCVFPPSPRRFRVTSHANLAQEPGRPPSTFHRHGVASRFWQHWRHHRDLRV